VAPPAPPHRDPLLDPPEGAPDWLPSVDRERSLGRLRRGIWVVLALGVAAFLLRGADRPPDPELGPPDPALDVSGPAVTVPGPGDPAALPGPPERVPLPGFGEVAVEVTPPGGDLLSWCLLAAREAAQRSRGLMEVTDLGGYPGMAFLFDEPTTGGFWMRNTPMPLTIAWVDPAGTVIGTTDMEPCADSPDCPTYPPPGPYQLAIEVPQGRHVEAGLVPGATVVATGACPGP
jgi:uncharacterized protein